MKIFRDWLLAVGLLVPSVAIAQSAQEATGIQAASLALLDDALLQFEQGNAQESVKDLRSSAAIMRIEGKSYAASEIAFMEAGAAEAERLAAAVSDKSLSTKERFRFAAAGVVLQKANAHYGTVIKTWAAVQRVKTGEEVLALSHSLKHGILWTNGKVSDRETALFARAEATSQKLLLTESMPATEIVSVISALGDELQALNKAKKRIL